MFGKYGFRVKANFILCTKFSYDPLKFHPAQTRTWTHTINASYKVGMTPADAAAIFMMVQVNLLSPEARYTSPFVKDVFNAILALRPEMSGRGRQEMLLALKEYSSGDEQFIAQFTAREKQFARQTGVAYLLPGQK